MLEAVLSPENVRETPVSSPRKSLAIIYNPTAGQRRQARLKRTLEALESLGADVALHATTHQGHAREIATSLATSDVQPDAIVAAGGDGTINEILNGIVDAQIDDIPLGIIPLGTANVLAIEIGLPTSPEKVARALIEAPAQNISTGTANGRRFIMMAGAGLDAHVVEKVDLRLKKRVGPLAYVYETLRQIARGYGERYDVTIDGKTYQAGGAVIANGHYYGGRYVCAPDARIHAPSLDVCLFGQTGRCAALKYGAGLVLGFLRKLPSFQVIRADTIHINGRPGDPVQADGEIVARLPVEIRVGLKSPPLIMPA
ncbi:MAG: diacylglycerol kinase family protein [Pseudomonadota bacterium]